MNPNSLIQKLQRGPRLSSALASAAIRPTRLWGKPVHLQVEPTTFCNLRCPQCPRIEYVSEPVHMGLTDFARIIDAVRPLALTLNGLGEPTRNPALPQMIHHAVSRGARVNTTSNFARITGEQIDALLTSGLDLLNISVDAATPGTYAGIRVGGEFSSVMDNLRHLAKFRNSRRGKCPMVRLCFVVQRSNVAEMAAFYNMASDLRCDEVLFQVFGSFGADRWNLVDGFDMETFRAQIQIVASKARARGSPRSNIQALARNIDDVGRIYDRNRSSRYRHCIMPWISAYISAEAEVRPCCRFAPRKLTWGSFHTDTDMGAILNADRFQGFRCGLKSATAPDILCAECLPATLADAVFSR